MLEGTINFSYNSHGAVIVHVDGACYQDGYPDAVAGIGVFFGCGNPLNVSALVKGPQTSHLAELQAARAALTQARRARMRYILINTDSPYLYNTMTDWIFSYVKGGWKLTDGSVVAYREELVELWLSDRLVGSVVWRLIPRDLNKEANMLARQGINSDSTYF